MCFISSFICCNFYNVLCMSYLPKLGYKYFSIFQRFLPSLGYKRTLLLVCLFQIWHQNGYWVLLTNMLFILSKKILPFSFYFLFLQIFENISKSRIFFSALILNGVAFLKNKNNVCEVNAFDLLLHFFVCCTFQNLCTFYITKGSIIWHFYFRYGPEIVIGCF